MEEQTLIIFKPDAVKRQMVGKLLKLWEEKGYTIVAARLFRGGKDVFSRHYAEHAGKPFFDALVDRMSSAKCMVFIISGPNVVKWSREILGATDPSNASVSSIRGAYATHYTENLVHASDSCASAEREITIWLPLIS